MYNIRKSNFEKEVINNAVKNTTIPMFLMLLYMCFLANENLHMNMLLSKL